MADLALLGGPRTIDRELAPYRPFGPEEEQAAAAVVRTGVLSAFVGAAGEGFLGGPQVQAFEREWGAAFEVEHAVSVNSATSGLVAAVGAAGIEPGDEVIVSPWTMSATATAIVVWQGIPVFADIEPETFNLDPAAVEACITPRTRAILVTDIFGHAARLDALADIARRHDLVLIEDAAQAPWALDAGRRVGTIADIGVFSLNYHKHIHTGEGGMCVTRDAALAERMRLIRNHAESAVDRAADADALANMVGFNFRLGEIEAAIGREQLRKLDRLATSRTRVGTRLTEQLAGLDDLRTPAVRDGCAHVYYVYGMVLEGAALEVGRERLLAALAAEGVPALAGGYVNVHLLPMFQRRIAFGCDGTPWTAGRTVSYAPGICPVAEDLHARTLIALETCVHQFDDDDVDLVAAAFGKVWASLDALR